MTSPICPLIQSPNGRLRIGGRLARGAAGGAGGVVDLPDLPAEGDSVGGVPMNSSEVGRSR